jgi:hypothetical protein
VEWLRQQVEARRDLAREAAPKTDGRWWRRLADRGYLDDRRLEPVGALYAGEPLLDADDEVCGGEFIVVYDEGAPSDAQFGHIAANDPRDVIARCEAELAILDLHQMVIPAEFEDEVKEWLECRECGPNNDASGVYAAPGSSETFAPCRTLHLVAAGYKHHEGYAEHWGDAGIIGA